VEQVLRREAEKHQEDWQIPTRVIGGGRTKNTLSMFLQHLFDNNEPGSSTCTRIAAWASTSPAVRLSPCPWRSRPFTTTSCSRQRSRS
jgi:hypothetical protein